jgi:hypothetical protein
MIHVLTHNLHLQFLQSSHSHNTLFIRPLSTMPLYDHAAHITPLHTALHFEVFVYNFALCLFLLSLSPEIPTLNTNQQENHQHGLEQAIYRPVEACDSGMWRSGTLAELSNTHVTALTWYLKTTVGARFYLTDARKQRTGGQPSRNSGLSGRSGRSSTVGSTSTCPPSSTRESMRSSGSLEAESPQAWSFW